MVTNRHIIVFAELIQMFGKTTDSSRETQETLRKLRRRLLFRFAALEACVLEIGFACIPTVRVKSERRGDERMKSRVTKSESSTTRNVRIALCFLHLKMQASMTVAHADA